ncbi:MAG: glycosyltransferase [Christiangramia sp.]|nr:glycosyltransferase [Christiangramia sp.]
MLIINNSGFVQDNDSVYITKTTGVFLEDLREKTPSKLSLLQLIEDGNVKNGINDFKLNGNFKIITVPYLKGYKKLFSYLNALIAIFKTISRNKNFTYIFYPGHVPLMVAYSCILFKKPFGLYVRGEYNSKISKPVFQRAKFINTVGTIFQNDISVINEKCFLIKPMVQFDFSKNNNIRNLQRKNEILFVGRIEKNKGVWEIVEAAKRLKKFLPNYIFRLIGGGPAFEEIKEFIDQNDLTNVILQGPVYDPETLSDFYLQSKIFLFPSYNEGFPRVLYEAMHFKIPIITTFVGNIPGLMKNEYNCLKIDVRSVDSIVQQLKKLVPDSELSEKLTRNGEDSLSLIFNDTNIAHSELLSGQVVNNE